MCVCVCVCVCVCDGGGEGGIVCTWKRKGKSVVCNFPVRYLEMVSMSSVGVYVILVFLCISFHFFKSGYPLVASAFLEKIGHYGARAFSFEKACFVVGSFA